MKRVRRPAGGAVADFGRPEADRHSTRPWDNPHNRQNPSVAFSQRSAEYNPVRRGTSSDVG